MASDEVVIDLVVNDSDVKAKMEESRRMAKEVAEEWRTDHKAMMRSLSEMSQGFNHMVRIYKTGAKVFGYTIDKSVSAILTLIQSSIMSMLQIAAAFTSTGIGAVAGALFAAGALGLNIGTTAAVIVTGNEAKGELKNAIAFLDSISGYAYWKSGGYY